MPSTSLPPTIRRINEPTTTIPPKGRPKFVKGKKGAGSKFQSVSRGLLLKSAVRIDPKLFSLDRDALDPHLVATPEAFWHTRSANMQDPTKHCTVEEGKKPKPGKLALAFLSEAQRQAYNRMHPDKPQVLRAGPVLRVCAGLKKPLLMPVENFEDAYEKGNAVRDCVLGHRGSNGKRSGGATDTPQACAIKVAGGPLAVAGLRSRRRSRR